MCQKNVFEKNILGQNLMKEKHLDWANNVYYIDNTNKIQFYKRIICKTDSCISNISTWRFDEPGHGRGHLDSFRK